MQFKKDFVWGVATASYQIEGGAYEDGKGLNIWDVFSKRPGKVVNNENGDVACDHYHRYLEDIQLMKEMGVKAYRLSLSWARILPEGIGEVNQKGIDFYNRIIDALVQNGITPYITLFHWDLPYALHKKGGWLNNECVEWFSEYARVVAENFSDRVKHFFTMNEPQIFIGLGYVSGIHAPGYQVSPNETFQMAHNTLKAHGAGVIALRQYAKQEIKVGIAPTSSFHYPKTESAEDIEAARQMTMGLNKDPQQFAMNVTWWSDPIFFGRYPEEGLKLYKDYLPEITEEDMALISQPLDFLGQNIYNGGEVCMNAEGKPEFVDRKQGYALTALKWPVTPKSLYWGPRFLYERYQIPIMITENGLSCHDMVSLDGKVHDPNRIDFLQRYLRELRRASADGVDVMGYLAWSFMDNFEWHSGYAERFGLVYVDYETQERIVKDSGHWYKTIIDSNGELL